MKLKLETPEELVFLVEKDYCGNKRVNKFFNKRTATNKQVLGSSQSVGNDKIFTITNSNFRMKLKFGHVNTSWINGRQAQAIELTHSELENPIYMYVDTITILGILERSSCIEGVFDVPICLVRTGNSGHDLYIPYIESDDDENLKNSREVEKTMTKKSTSSWKPGHIYTKKSASKERYLCLGNWGPILVTKNHSNSKFKSILKVLSNNAYLFEDTTAVLLLDREGDMEKLLEESNKDLDVFMAKLSSSEKVGKYIEYYLEISKKNSVSGIDEGCVIDNFDVDLMKDFVVTDLKSKKESFDMILKIVFDPNSKSDPDVIEEVKKYYFDKIYNELKNCNRSLDGITDVFLCTSSYHVNSYSNTLSILNHCITRPLTFGIINICGDIFSYEELLEEVNKILKRIKNEGGN